MSSVYIIFFEGNSPLSLFAHTLQRQLPPCNVNCLFAFSWYMTPSSVGTNLKYQIPLSIVLFCTAVRVLRVLKNSNCSDESIDPSIDNLHIQTWWKWGRCAPMHLLFCFHFCLPFWSLLLSWFWPILFISHLHSWSSRYDRVSIWLWTSASFGWASSSHTQVCCVRVSSLTIVTSWEISAVDVLWYLANWSS